MTFYSSKTRWTIGISIIALAVIVLVMLNLKSNVVYFYTPKEVQEQAASLQGRTIRVGAMVEPNSVHWEPTELALSFRMTDFSGSEINASYRGTPPDLFKEGQGVVVEGRINHDGREMIAEKLMVKHSEEYRKPSDKSVDHELLMKSLFKN